MVRKAAINRTYQDGIAATPLLADAASGGYTFYPFEAAGSFTTCSASPNASTFNASQLLRVSE